MSDVVPRRETGHSLIEVLVALALTSAGVIGFMHMQHWRTATETELLSRIQAAIFARDMLRKISTNPDALDAYHASYGSPPPNATRCRDDGCSPKQLARFHVAHWKCRLGRWAKNPVCLDTFKVPAALPSGDGKIVLSDGNVGIAVRWVDADRQFRSFEINSPSLRH